MFWSAIVHANARGGMAVSVPPDIAVLAKRARALMMLGAAAVFGALLQLGAPQSIVADGGFQVWRGWRRGSQRRAT